MSDAEIRALERSYNEAPNLATGVAYFRALERVGRATKKQSQTLALLETPPNQADLEFAFGLGWQPAVVVRHLCEGVEEAPTSGLAWLADDTRWLAVERLTDAQCIRFYGRIGEIRYVPKTFRGYSDAEITYLLHHDTRAVVERTLTLYPNTREVLRQRDLYCECLFNLDHLSL